MRIEGDVVVFRSTLQYYRLEISGWKSNTVRLLNKAEYEAIMMDDECWKLTKIRIEHSEHPIAFSFERELTNISLIGELVGHYLVVFSWKHKGEG